MGRFLREQRPGHAEPHPNRFRQHLRNGRFFEPGHPDIDGLMGFHYHLSIQAGAYQNGM